MMSRCGTVGVTGEQVQNTNPAGMGQTFGSKQDYFVSMRDNTGNFTVGDYASNAQGSSNSCAAGTDPKTITSSELVGYLHKYECSDTTIKSFSDKKVTGRLFMTRLDKVIKVLHITDMTEVMKLENLKDELSQ